MKKTINFVLTFALLTTFALADGDQGTGGLHPCDPNIEVCPPPCDPMVENCDEGNSMMAGGGDSSDSSEANVSFGSVAEAVEATIESSISMLY